MDDPFVLAIGIVVLAIVALVIVEWWTVKTGRPTISKRFQDFNQASSKQLIIGYGIVIGLLVGWFAAHFTSFGC